MANQTWNRLAGCLVLVSAVLCSPSVGAQDELDLGFEDVSRAGSPSRWKANPDYPFDSVESVVGDPRHVRSGEAALRLAATADPARPDSRGHLHTRDDIAVTPGVRYGLSLWARGEGRVGALAYGYGPKDGGAEGFIASVWPQAAAENPAGGAVSDEEWQRYRYEFEPGGDGTTITSVRLVVLATGTIYVDDVSWDAVGDDEAPVAPSPESLRVNLLTVPRATGPPVVDGRFGQDEYAVRATGLINQTTHELYEYPARFGVSRDSDRLYFALSVDLPEGYEVKSSPRRRDEPGLIAARDVFYMMIRPDDAVDTSTFEGAYLAVAPDGTIYDAWEEVSWSEAYCRRDAAFDASPEAAVHLDGRRYSLEISVPFASVKLDARAGETYALSFGLNLEGHAVAWQAHPNWFDHPQAFGQLRIEGEEVAASIPTIGSLARGQAQPTFELSNSGEASADYEVTYLISTPKMVGGRVGSYIFDQALDVREKTVARDLGVFSWHETGQLPGGQRRVEQGSGSLDEPGPYVVETEVRIQGEPIFYQIVPFRFLPPLTASLTPIPSRDQLVADLSVRGARPEERGRVRVSFTDNAGAEALSEEVAVDRDQMSVTLSMADLAPGDYDADFALDDRDGQAVTTVTLPFKKWPTPAWLAERAGIDALDADWVPEPWSPVETGADQVSVWGRRFDFGADTLVESISSQDQPLLAEGISLRYEIGGEQHAVEIEPPTVSSTGRGRARVEQRGTSDHFALTARHRIEFDGMDRIDVTLTPRGPVRVERVWIEIPFRKFPYSILMANEGPGSQYWQRGLVSDRLFSPPRAFNVVWLGDDRVGFAFFTENYRGWVVDSSQPRISLASDETSRRLRLNVVNDPSDLSEPVAITFGLHPTPFKPRFSGWRDLRTQGLAIEPPPVNAAFVHASIWNSCDSKPSPRSWQVLGDIVDFAHGRGQRVFPYLGTFFISPYDNIRRDTAFDPAQGRFPDSQLLRKKAEATRQEEFFYFAEDWHLRPRKVNEPEWETRQEVRTAAGSSWADYFVHGIAEMLERTDVDGFYLDIANPMLDMNEDRELTVVTKDGKREGTRELFAARDLYKRLYRVFEQRRGPERRPWMFGHGFAVSVPYSPFWDVNFNCEEVKPSAPFGFTSMNLQDSLEGTPLAKRVDSDEARSFDAHAFRAHFGEQFGVPNVVLPQYGYKPALNTPAHSREMLSWTFLHNAMLWPAYIPSQPVYEFWSKVEVPFGMGDTEFHPYWANGVAPRPASVKVSYWSKAERDDFLLAAANWSEQEVSATIPLPEALRQFNACVDMETGEALECGDTLRATLPPHDLRAFRFQAPAAN